MNKFKSKSNIKYDGYVTINEYVDNVLYKKSEIHNSGTSLLFQLIREALTGEIIESPKYIALYENKDTLIPCLSQKIKASNIKISDDGISYTFLIPGKDTYKSTCNYIILSNHSDIKIPNAVAEINKTIDLTSDTNIEITWLLTFENSQEGSELNVS